MIKVFGNKIRIISTLSGCLGKCIGAFLILNVDEKERKMINMKLHKAFYKGNHINFVLALSGSVGKSIVAIMVAFLIKQFIDIAIGGNMADLKSMMFNFGLFLILMIVVETITFFFTNRFIQRGMRQYKEEVYSKVMDKDINTFMKEPTSDYLSVLTNDAASIELNYLQGIFQIITLSMMFLAGLFAMAYLNLLLTTCVIAASIVPMLVSVCFGKHLTTAEQRTSTSNANFVGMVKDALSGFSVIKSFRAEPEIMINYMQENEQLEVNKKHRRDIIGILSVISSVSGFLVDLVVFGFGSYLTLQGTISAGTVIAFIQLLNYIITPIQELPPLLGSRKAASGLIKKAEQKCIKQISDKPYKEVSEFKDAIKLHDVSFFYEEANPVLSHISTTFEKGKRYAIVGGSGSGKSTLLNLLLGYYQQQEGEIFFDEHPLDKVKSDDLYELISIIQQNVFIFNGTLLDNITMYKKFPKNEVIEACGKAGLKELLNQKGASYLCGENGCALSGGEKQRVSIARSLLKKTPILFMDEATAALDTVTAHLVEEAILEIENLTSIIVTHKLDEKLLRQYDKILVLHKGELREQGTFDELYAKKDYFYSLYTISAS